MVIVRLNGGLGNQLFQYATGRALACRKKVPLKLDITYFDEHNPRRYCLHHFKIRASLADQNEINRLKRWESRLHPRLLRLIARTIPYYRRSLFEEQNKDFYDPNINRAPRDVYLAGYWQSDRYFEDIASLLRAELVLSHPLDLESQTIAKEIQQTESVSVHVRRGDYVANPEMRYLYGAPGADYYLRAIGRLSEIVKHPNLFLFSDDLTWTRQNIRPDFPVHYVCGHGRDRDVEEFSLMQECKYHIIANSSFSWWGAWLSNHHQKIVIAPKDWFNVPERSTEDRIPPSWIKI